MNQSTPDPSREGSQRSPAASHFPSWEGVGPWFQCNATKPTRPFLHVSPAPGVVYPES